MTPQVNTIQIPREFVEICEHWHGGQSSMLYAISSTGNLTVNLDYVNRHSARDAAEIYCELWDKLCTELNLIVLWCQENTPDEEDLGVLQRFHTFAKTTRDQLQADHE